MKRNSLIGLAIAAAVVVVLAVIFAQQRISETKPAVGGGLMFEGLIRKVNSVASIQVNNGNEIFTIVRKAQSWGVAEKSAYPVQFDLVKKTIMGVAELDLVAAKTKNPDRHGALGLNTPEAEEGGSIGLILADDTGTTLASLLVGKTVRAGGERRYVRRPNEDQTWLGNGGIDVGKTPLDWMEIILTQIRHDRIRKITFSHPDGDRAVLERMEQSDFDFTYMEIPGGMRALAPSKLNSVGGGLAFLSMKDVRLASGMNFDPREAIVTRFETWDGIVVTVSTIETDEKRWARFEAEFDESLVLETVPSVASDVDESADETEEAEDPQAVAREEAGTISTLTSGWAYALDDHKMDQLRKRSEDFIEPDLPDEADGSEDLTTNQ